MLLQLKESPVFGSVFKAYAQAYEANMRLEDAYSVLARILGRPGGLGVQTLMGGVHERIASPTPAERRVPQRTASASPPNTSMVAGNGQKPMHMETENLKQEHTETAKENCGESGLAECAEGEGKGKKRRSSERE